MRTQKKFDCVKLKDEIQARLLAEYRGLSDEEITRRIHRKLEASDSPVARWWRAIVAREAKSVATGGSQQTTRCSHTRPRLTLSSGSGRFGGMRNEG